MDRRKFLAELDALSNKAMQSNDKEVRQSAVVLLGLQGAILAGDTFFEAFVDNVAIVVKNQNDTLKRMR